MTVTQEVPFANVVGQEETKSTLGFYIDSYHYTRLMPNIMLCAAKGQGKSLMAKETARQLVLYNEKFETQLKDDGVTLKKKNWYEITATSIPNTRALVKDILSDLVQDKDCTIFIDEASQLKPDVTISLLSILNPNPLNRNTFTHEGMTYDIDFKRNTFIFATSESHLVFPPLMDRLTRVDLQPYTHADLANIVAKSAPEVSFIEGVLEDISSVVRGNGRQCCKMASDIRAFLHGATVFGRLQWKELVKRLSIKPLGLSPIEIQLLQFMKARPNGSSLTNLSARSGLSRESLQKDYESFLQFHGLMEITAGKGRVLTSKGDEYLKLLSSNNLVQV